MNNKNFDLLKHYDHLKHNNIILSYKGALSQDILIETGESLKSKIEDSKKVKKIFGIFVEFAQNIMHYSEERENNEDKGIGVIVITEEIESYVLYSGNIIKKEKENIIKNKIDFINSKTKEELKKLYKEKIKMRPENDSKGAGLGFIDIARKSDSKLTYKFMNISESQSFLIISVKLNKD